MEDVFLNDVWKLYYHAPDDDDWTPSGRSGE